MLVRTVLFVIINFLGLYIGAASTSTAVLGNWYQNLNKAPWTPPGWVFGVAWTSIMLCFAIYMALLWKKETNKTKLIVLFAIQWILNVIWNPIFFSWHWMGIGLLVITALCLLIWYFLLVNRMKLRWATLLLLPYGIWMLIATSLNAFAYLKN